MITAIVLIDADAARIPETAQAVADTDGVAEVYSCAGDVDLIAIVRTREINASPMSSPVASTRSRE